MSICLKSKLEDNPNYLNEYAMTVARTKKIELSKVSSLILNDFEESSTFVRNHLDAKFKNQKMVNHQSRLTRLRNKISRQQSELSLSTALYESWVNANK